MWSMRRIVGKRWGAALEVMLRLINQVVLPKLFYGVECWGTFIRSEQMLQTLNRVMSTAARLAMGLDRCTSIDVSLVVAGIIPARLQILRQLCRFMVRNHQCDLVSSRREEVPSTFLLPREVAKSWFCRAIFHKGLLIDPPPVRSHLLLSVEVAKLFLNLRKLGIP